MSWFNVLLSVRQRLNNNEDYKKMCQVTDSLDGTGDIQERKNILSKYFAEHQILSTTKVTEDKKCWEVMSLTLDAQNQETVSNAVEQAYTDISGVTLDETNSKAYADIISRIINTEGSFLHKEKKLDEYDPIDDKATKQFIDSFNTLKTSEHTVKNICNFLYSNNFQNVKLSNITGEEKSKVYTPMFEDVQLVSHIVKSVSDIKSHVNIFKNNIYKALIQDYESDSDFISVMKKVNPNNKYLDGTSVVCVYNSEKADKILESINSVYVSDKIIGIGLLARNLGSDSWTMKKFKNLATTFKDKKVPYSMNRILTEMTKFIETHQSTNQVIDDSNYDKLALYVDNAIVTLLNGYFETIQNININISKCNTLLSEGIELLNMKHELKQFIQMWKSFIASDIFRWSGKNITEDCSKRCADLIASNKKKYEPQIDTNANIKVFNKDVTDVIDVIKHIDISNNANMFISIIQYLIPQYAKDDAPIIAKVSICKVMLEYLKDFFSIDFKDKATFKMAEYKGNYYDAVCCIIYKNDKAIPENINHYVDDSFIMFESFVINEDKDYKAYFQKLSDHMKSAMNSDEPDALQYVKTKGEYDNLESSTIDSSTADSSTSNNTQINTMVTDAAQQAKDAMSDFSGEIDTDVLDAAISSK